MLFLIRTVLAPLLLLLLLCAAPLGSTTSLQTARYGVETRDQRESRVNINCAECHVIVGALQALAHGNGTLEEMEEMAIDICQAAHLFTFDVCEQMVFLSAPEIIYVLNNTVHDLNTICHQLFRVCPSHLPEWSVNVPGGKPASSHPDPVQGPRTYRILHLSDTHYDPLYETGAPTVCDHPLCCRQWGGEPDPDSPPAGVWGAESGECDAPLRTLEAALQAALELQPDIIYMTGDLPPHDVWMQSHDSIRASVNSTAAVIRQYFPDTPVAYALGNHEAAPVNSYAVPATYSDGWNMDWLYSLLVAVWGEAGVPPSLLDTVQRGGYYHWSPVPGLRVVALNNNYGFWQNWFLLMDHVDPTGELLWLAGVLQEAEEAGEKVHILGHIHPGGLLDSWSHQFNRIITRFESTITGIFAGHSHKDEVEVQWDVEDNTRPTSVTFVAPSISSNGVKSPSFRVYEVDGGYDNATWALLDHLTYSMNLTEANLGAEPTFPLAYTARQAYGLTSLSPASWADLVWQMATDDGLFEEFLRHYYSFSADPQQVSSCDTSCRRGFLCDMYSGDHSDDEPCIRVMEQVPNNTVWDYGYYDY